jgi:hypothetical protein
MDNQHNKLAIRYLYFEGQRQHDAGSAKNGQTISDTEQCLVLPKTKRELALTNSLSSFYTV